MLPVGHKSEDRSQKKQSDFQLILLFSCMILVTGGTGLLGSHLLYYLSKSGKEVIALKRSSANIQSVKETFRLLHPFASQNGVTPERLFDSIRWVEGNLFNINNLNDIFKEYPIKKVYHCAGFVSYAQQDRDMLMDVNVKGTENIVNACIENKIKKLCYVSSIAAFSRSADGEVINENYQWKDSPLNTNYAISKYLAELEAWRGIAEGLPTVIINPSVIFGFGNWTNSSNQIIMKAWEGFRFYTDGINGFIDSRDVAKIMILLMESDITDERFIISEGNYSTQFIFQCLAENFGKKKPDIKISRSMAELGWRTIAFRDLFRNRKSIISKEAARAAFYKSAYDNDKIKKTLNYQFIPITQTIKEICSSFQSWHNQNQRG